jgi:hypothetical protein
MGHIVNPDKEYRLLRQRYDRQVTGAPDSPHMITRCETWPGADW